MLHLLTVFTHLVVLRLQTFQLLRLCLHYDLHLLLLLLEEGSVIGLGGDSTAIQVLLRKRSLSISRLGVRIII